MFPKVVVTVDGQAVAGAFYERLVSITVTDKEGIESDTFQMELNDGPPSFLAIPATGAIVNIAIGYDAPQTLGTFVVDKVSCKCFPFSMSISGKAADLGSGKLKEKQERHWDEKTVKDIVEQVAGESGLSAEVDGEIGAHMYPWFGQQDESNIQMLRRLEKRHNGLFAIKQGRLIFAKRGSGNAVSGSFMGSVVVTPSIIIEGSCSFEANDRTKYKQVVAYYQDKAQAKRIEVPADSDASGDSIYRIPEPFSDPAEADKAAQSKAKDLKRGEGAASVTVIGNTGIVAGAPLLFSGVRPGLDGVPYIIDTATHSYSKNEGYRTQISAKLYDGTSGGDSGNSNDSKSTSTDTNGTVAADSAATTTATPSSWTGPTRNGLTDSN